MTVLRPPTNTGSKAGAQTFALPNVRSEFVMAMDADTTLAPDAIEKLLERHRTTGCCCRVRLRLRGRFGPLGARALCGVLFAFSVYKQIQDYYEKPLISSGCFSVYRTAALRQRTAGRRARWRRTWT